MSRIEIVPDQVGGFTAYGKEFHIHPATDVIMRFVDHEYDYLSYLDQEEGGITMHWLGNTALATIVTFGIPETRERLKMTESEHEEYLSYKSQVGLWEYEREVADIPEPTEGFGDAA